MAVVRESANRGRSHAAVGGVAERLPYTPGMGQTTYRLVRQKDGRIGVEMTKPSGRKRIIPDFRDEADANAWIIQTQRLIETAHPHLPGVKKRA